MVTQNQVRLGRRFPAITLLVVTAAVIVHACPGLGQVLVYDRSAIANGELWRLVTGQWVHFSMRHLLYDSLAFGIAGWMIEWRTYPNFGWLCGIAPLVIGMGLFLSEPHLEIYGGLSGVATAAVVFLALWGLEERGAWRWICLIALVATVGKILFESLTGHFVFLKQEDHSIILAPASHICGALTALTIYAWSKLKPRAITGG